MRIFLSYRRSDVGGYAGRLSDTLTQRLGPANVFQDVTGIAAGRDFVAEMRAALDKCDAAIAVIGPGWVTASTADGRRRLFEPDDYVRLELATVLRRNLPVAPVLVGGAELPAAADLPDDLRPLIQRQAIEVRDESWHHDVDNLLRSLRGEAAAPSTGTDDRAAGRRALAMAAGGVAVAVILALLLWRPWSGGSSDAEGSASADPALTCPDPTGPGWTSLALSADPKAVVESEEGPYAIFVRSARWRSAGPGRWDLILDTTFENRSTSEMNHDFYRYTAVIVAQRVFPQTCYEQSESFVRPGTVSDGRSGYVVTCEPSGRVDLILAGSPETRFRATAESEPGRC